MRRLGFQTLKPIPKLSAPDVDRNPRICPRANQPRFSVDAVPRHLFAHDHMAEEAARNLVVPVLAPDVLVELARSWAGRCDGIQHRVLAVGAGFDGG